MANAASFVLPVSNPSNLLITARAPLPLDAFLASLLLPSALALLTTLIGLLVVFRNDLAAPVRFTPSTEPIQMRTRLVGLGIAVLAAAYAGAAAQAWPLGIVASMGGIALVALDSLVHGWEPHALKQDIAWALFPLLAGLLLLVGGGERLGLFTPMERLVAAAAAQPALGPPLLTLGLALLANVLNNLPTALVVASALGSLPQTPAREHLAAAAIVGVNLGPNLTTIGSLATMLWLLLLRRRGVDVSPLAYLRIGAAVTVPALLAAAAGVWLALR